MPKLGCNGFSLFAEQMRPSLEEAKGKKLAKFNDLISAAGPYWQTLPEDEKRDWKERARHYKRSDTYHAKKKKQRMRGLDAKGKRGFPGSRFGRRGESEEPLNASDTLDPLELPGPVSRWRPPALVAPSSVPPPPHPATTAAPPLNASAAPSARVLDMACGSAKALARLGIVGPSGRLMPQARLFVPASGLRSELWSGPGSEDEDWSSGAEEMDDPALLHIPKPLCGCPRKAARARSGRRVVRAALCPDDSNDAEDEAE